MDVLPIDNGPNLQVADARAHTPTHVGYPHLSTTSLKEPIHVRCYYMPTLPVTIILPGAMSQQHRGAGYSAHINFSKTNVLLIRREDQIVDA